MPDTTVSTLVCASDSGPIPRCNISRRTADRGDEDELLARVLVTSWNWPPGAHSEPESRRSRTARTS